MCWRLIGTDKARNTTRLPLTATLVTAEDGTFFNHSLSPALGQAQVQKTSDPRKHLKPWKKNMKEKKTKIHEIIRLESELDIPKKTNAFETEAQRKAGGAY